MKQTEYRWVYLSAAVNPETGKAFGMVTRTMNTLTMNDLLANLSRMVNENKHAVLIWDNAGFHRSDSLEVPKNITLYPLPPYSPELNPIERVWHWMRSHYLSNRVYADHDELEVAANEACSRLDAPRLQTITHTEWIERSY